MNAENKDFHHNIKKLDESINAIPTDTIWKRIWALIVWEKLDLIQSANAGTFV